jgi:transcriptional regulator with XRE-family HTH domain
MLLAERLRAERARKGWSLDDLAARSGVNRITIHRAEHAAERISAPVVMALAHALGVTMDYLCGMDAYKPPRRQKARRRAA